MVHEDSLPTLLKFFKNYVYNMIAYFDKLSKRKVIWIKGSLPSSKFEGVRHSRFAKAHIIQRQKITIYVYKQTFYIR